MHIKSLVKQFEEIMSSAAFAEAGEIGSAIRILHERHKVLLVLTGDGNRYESGKICSEYLQTH